MHYAKWYTLWTNPDREMEAAFRHSSVILFTIRQGRDVVIATRCPSSPSLPIGGSLFRVLDVPEDVRTELLRQSGDMRPMFLRTRVGVGIIDRTYAQETGIYIYVHIHSRPGRLAALLGSGALGDPSNGCFWVCREIREASVRRGLLREKDYGILADVWADVEARRRGLLRLGEDGTVYRAQLEELIEDISRYVGCDVRFDRNSWEVLHMDREGRSWATRMRCHRPAVCEALLLCLLCEAHEYATESPVRVRISTVTGQEGDALSLSLCYTVDSAARFVKGQLMRDWIHQYLQFMAHAHGLGVSVQTEYPLEGRARYCRHPEVCFTVDWVRDPTVLESSDIKAGDRWLEETLLYGLPSVPDA